MHNRDWTTWRTYDDRDILVKDLSTRHLVNILNWIKETNENAGWEAYDHYLYEFLEGEAQYRIIQGFAGNTGIPMKQDDGTWTLVNRTPEEKAKDDAETEKHRQAAEAEIKRKGAERKKTQKEINKDLREFHQAFAKAIRNRKQNQ
jgi:hypothetical protein